MSSSEGTSSPAVTVYDHLTPVLLTYMDNLRWSYHHLLSNNEHPVIYYARLRQGGGNLPLSPGRPRGRGTTPSRRRQQYNIIMGVAGRTSTATFTLPTAALRRIFRLERKFLKFCLTRQTIPLVSCRGTCFRRPKMPWSFGSLNEAPQDFNKLCQF